MSFTSSLLFFAKTFEAYSITLSWVLQYCTRKIHMVDWTALQYPFTLLLEQTSQKR